MSNTEEIKVVITFRGKTCECIQVVQKDASDINPNVNEKGLIMDQADLAFRAALKEILESD